MALRVPGASKLLALCYNRAFMGRAARGAFTLAPAGEMPREAGIRIGRAAGKESGSCISKFNSGFAKSFVFFMSLLGNLARIFVTDMCIERGYQHQRIFHVLFDNRQVGLNAFSAHFMENEGYGGGQSTKGGLPKVGETFNGGKVLSVEEVK